MRAEVDGFWWGVKDGSTSSGPPGRKGLVGAFRSSSLAFAAARCESAVLDGRIVCLDVNGRPCFESRNSACPAEL